MIKKSDTRLLERDIEKYLCVQVKKARGEVRKLQWLGRAHAPDRVVLLKGLHLVEVKAPGEAPRAGQAREFARIAILGAQVWVLSTKEEVDHFILWINGA